MAAISEDELNVVFRICKRLRHALVGQGPVAELVVQIGATVLQKDPDRLARGPADQRLVVVAAFDLGWTASDVGERADPGKHFAELVRALPGDREGADSAAAHPGDGAR